MPSRCSLLFAVTTGPTDLVNASAHSGGWSESHWLPGIANLANSNLAVLAQRRAALLPSLAQIIGYRIEIFTISGNKLLPGGTSSGRFRYPGTWNSLNLPQDGLQESGTTATGPNAARFVLRGMPDAQIALGEYQPTTGFTSVLNSYNTLLAGGWGFAGRVLTNPSVRVMAITIGGLATLSAIPAGLGAGDFLRLNRVRDQSGRPVIGSFEVQAPAGLTVQLNGYTGQVVGRPNGLARKDQIAIYLYSLVVPTRAVIRKIGRPFEQYRGRRSKRPVF